MLRSMAPSEQKVLICANSDFGREIIRIRQWHCGENLVCVKSEWADGRPRWGVHLDQRAASVFFNGFVFEQYLANSDPSPLQSPGERVLATMGHFFYEMCTCVDKPCTTRVNDDMVKWEQQLMRDGDERHKLSEDRHQRSLLHDAVLISERVNKCMTAVMTKTSPSP